MRNSKSYFIIAIFSLMLLFSCTNRNQTESDNAQIEDTASPKQQEVAMAYACPMHPEVTSDQPGQCSKCGMDLVKQETEQQEQDDNADSRIGK